MKSRLTVNRILILLRLTLSTWQRNAKYQKALQMKREMENLQCFNFKSCQGDVSPFSKHFTIHNFLDRSATKSKVVLCKSVPISKIGNLS